MPCQYKSSQQISGHEFSQTPKNRLFGLALARVLLKLRAYMTTRSQSPLLSSRNRSKHHQERTRSWLGCITFLELGFLLLYQDKYSPKPKAPYANGDCPYLTRTHCVYASPWEKASTPRRNQIHLGQVKASNEPCYSAQVSLSCT